ncbi:hypothetical protein L873DRAFT_1813355 [Choiromyces venosus 120613-1]|uniref:Uncharacterized protein n=1 Tax=Choiromyces venosus 120613-1 TaxID=1336337 RepID=A0A3N4JA65_9PEZI|nr:hypothetical protein L873DRAFT_1813355 [Choiromyces venosus 120613-1]
MGTSENTLTPGTSTGISDSIFFHVFDARTIYSATVWVSLFEVFIGQYGTVIIQMS